jgi:hypothetical protein
MENQTTGPAVKSNFVNVFAWLMIVFNGFGLLISIMQNIIVAFVFKLGEFDTAFKDMGDMPRGFPTFLFKNIRVLLPLIGVVIIFALISSIGLLKRKEWARKSFLFLLGFAILYTIAGTVFQTIFMKSMFHGTDIPSEFSFISTFFMIFMIIFSLGFIFLFGWLFKKLSSDKIKAEFILPVIVITEP